MVISGTLCTTQNMRIPDLWCFSPPRVGTKPKVNKTARLRRMCHCLCKVKMGVACWNVQRLSEHSEKLMTLVKTMEEKIELMAYSEKSGQGKEYKELRTILSFTLTLHKDQTMELPWHWAVKLIDLSWKHATCSIQYLIVFTEHRLKVFSQDVCERCYAVMISVESLLRWKATGERGSATKLKTRTYTLSQSFNHELLVPAANPSSCLFIALRAKSVLICRYAHANEHQRKVQWVNVSTLPPWTPLSLSNPQMTFVIWRIVAGKITFYIVRALSHLFLFLLLSRRTAKSPVMMMSIISKWQILETKSLNISPMQPLLATRVPQSLSTSITLPFSAIMILHVIGT